MKTLPPIGPIARYLIAVLIIGELAFVACGRKPPVVDPGLATISVARPAPSIAAIAAMETTALRTAVGAFERNPTEENQALAKLLFARLDAGIARLQEGRIPTSGATRSDLTAKLLTLQNVRASEMIRFDRAQDIRALNETPTPRPDKNRMVGTKTAH